MLENIRDSYLDISKCEICCSGNGVAADSSLLGGAAVSRGKCFPAFKRIVLPSSAGPSIFLGLLDYRHTAENMEIPEKETAF